jgi:two-component system, cell cycle sensor histidine kinase and response regulator CckA
MAWRAEDVGMQPFTFAPFFDLSTDLLCITDAVGMLLRVNAALRVRLNWSHFDGVGIAFTTLLHPDDQAAALAELARLAAGEAAPGFSCRCRMGKAGYSRVQWQGTYEPISGRIYLSGHDLSTREAYPSKREQLQAQVEQLSQALHVSENRLADTQRLANVGSWELDLATRQLWWSAEIYHVFEANPEHVSASLELFRQMVHPEDREAVSSAFATAITNQTPYEIVHRLLMADGRVKYVREHARTIYASDGAPIQAIGTMQDITRWKQTENELLRKDAAVAASLNGIAMSDLNGILTYVNQAFLDLWGYTDSAEVVGRPAISFWGTPTAAGLVVEALHLTGVWAGELEAMRADGIARTMQVNASLMRDAAAAPIGMLASFRDITERKKNEDALRLKDQAIATSLNAMVIADTEACIIYVNPSFLRLWGYPTEAEVVGRPLTQFADPGGTPNVLAQLYAQGAWQGELVARRKDGSSFEILLSANSVCDAGGTIKHLVGSILDISEAKRLQAQFLQAQKMESVGRLAGGVAHDFNNLLTVMRGYLDLGMLSLSPDDPLLADLAQVGKAVDSAAGLTQQLLAFSRRQIIAPQVINLNTVITRVQRMLRRLIGEDIELRTILAEELTPVRFDPGQCEQVVINLAINARDAMPSGGRLIIETAQVQLDEAYARRHSDSAPGNYVLLTIADTGIGMSAEVQSHLFEPFFTTKELGKGTGLGLAMVYGAVSQNNGRIEVYSEPGQGTSFKIYLPAAQPQTIVPKSAPAQALPRGTQTIILVEDDVSVRTLAMRLLDEQGYRVLAFGDGPAALRMVATLSEPVDLLVTDVILPQMNGRVLAEQIRLLCPQIRVLFTSGYTANVIVNQGILQEGVEFLAKPYSITTLAQRVREVLTGM